ncbi:putative Embryo-specific protein 3 [Hibiscus syriacus]|uniref:Embryo-specific protein 3 n=1 Tax=Hibiscus syriacus TaxID=106335 RepID=A0A6A3B5Q4_HIBSY|nr:putative Embryo-specific protein 3 [Hibiscus syriacus]
MARSKVKMFFIGSKTIRQETDRSLERNLPGNYNFNSNFIIIINFFTTLILLLSPAFRHLSYYNSASPILFPQAGIHDEAAKQVMNSTWKFDIPERVDKDNGMMRSYGSDWLMMFDVGSPLSLSSSSSCYSMISRPPLKTLELFPVTASDLKED